MLRISELLKSEAEQFLNSKQVLVEDIDSMRKYYKNIPEEDFLLFIAKDPTYKKGSNTAGKYAKWILALANKGLVDKDNNHIFDLLVRFDDAKHNLKEKDIMRHKSMVELEDMLNDEDSYLELTARQKLRQTQDAVRETDVDADVVYKDSDWTVYVPHNYEASCKLGRNSTWCTATTENDYYYNMYAKDGPLYINISNHEPDAVKYQFHFPSRSFMDIDDRSIDLKDFFKSNPDLAEFYRGVIAKEEFQADPSESLTVRLYDDDLVSILNSTTGYSRDKVNGQTAAALILNPFDEVQEWVDNSVVEANYDLSEYTRFSPEEVAEILSLTKFESMEALEDFVSKSSVDENDDLHEILRDAVNRATYDGYLVGSMEDAQKDAQQEFLDCFDSKWTIDFLDDSIMITAPVSTFVDEYVNNEIEYDIGGSSQYNVVAQLLVDQYCLIPPYNDWWEFSNTAFVNTFIECLRESLGE